MLTETRAQALGKRKTATSGGDTRQNTKMQGMFDAHHRRLGYQQVPYRIQEPRCHIPATHTTTATMHAHSLSIIALLPPLPCTHSASREKARSRKHHAGPTERNKGPRLRRLTFKIELRAVIAFQRAFVQWVLIS